MYYAAWWVEIITILFRLAAFWLHQKTILGHGWVLESGTANFIFKIVNIVKLAKMALGEKS